MIQYGRACPNRKLGHATLVYKTRKERAIKLKNFPGLGI
jgi:hypothetical protein